MYWVFVKEKPRLAKCIFHAKSWQKGKENVELYCDFRDGSKLETSFVKTVKSITTNS